MRLAQRFFTAGHSSCWPTDPLPVLSPGSTALGAAAWLVARWVGGSLQKSSCEVPKPRLAMMLGIV